MRVDFADAAPELWFPAESLRAELPRAGWWRAGDGELRDHICFDHDRVTVELYPAAPGHDVDPASAIRFPNWGDASDLIDIIDVTPEGGGRYLSSAKSDWRRPVVEGSQILGQALVAAAREAASDRRAVHASMMFLRAADARSPYHLDLDTLSAGRTFSAFSVRAVQGERLCAFGTVLLDATAPDAVRHADPAPQVSGPADATPFDMGVTGRELRVVDDAYTGDPDAPVGPPELSTWVRFAAVPDDQPLHAGLLAQFTGHMPIAAALRPHPGIGQDQAHRTLSTAINAISLSIHAEVRADAWMLYHHRSTFAGDGMTHAECRVYTETGDLAASFTVDAMVRGFADPSRQNDDRTAM